MAEQPHRSYATWSDRTCRASSTKEEECLPTGTAGGYIFPWPAWLQMGDRPGHMFSTWHGRKLSSIDELPEHFLRRAADQHEHLLAPDMSVFDRPLPEPLASRYGRQ